MDENYGYDDPEFEVPEQMSGILRTELDSSRASHLVVSRGGSGYCYTCDEEMRITQDGLCAREAQAIYRRRYRGNRG